MAALVLVVVRSAGARGKIMINAKCSQHFTIDWKHHRWQAIQLSSMLRLELHFDFSCLGSDHSSADSIWRIVPSRHLPPLSHR